MTMLVTNKGLEGQSGLDGASTYRNHDRPRHFGTGTAILVENQGFAAYMTRDAERIRIATMLVKKF